MERFVQAAEKITQAVRAVSSITTVNIKRLNFNIIKKQGYFKIMIKFL